MVLFVCTGNTCRSPMAEAFFSRKFGNMETNSAGVLAHENRPSKGAVEAMAAYGINIENHRPKKVSKELLEKAHIIITMTQAQKEMVSDMLEDVSRAKVYTFYQYVSEKDQDVADPYGGDAEVYRDTAQELEYLTERFMFD